MKLRKTSWRSVLSLQQEYPQKTFGLLPHETNYMRPFASSISGIGLVATRDIPKGTFVYYTDLAKNYRLVTKEEVESLQLPPAVKKLYEDFHITLPDGRWVVPADFNHLSIIWFLNHSDNPNLATNTNDWHWYATRDVKEGEELTGDYNAFDKEGTSGISV
jgi:SET domain-containing protein